MEYTLRSSTVVPADADEVFDLIADIQHLPDWNLEIRRVVSTPVRLEVGAEWVVHIHAMKTHWDSRSRVVELDRANGRFAYRTQTDDGNPSHADWRWQVAPAPDAQGTLVSVEVDVRPVTRTRRWVLARARKPFLQRAMHQSMRSLREHVSATR